jgi:hypothetical protein
VAQIGEDLFLLLLDNASEQPRLDRPRRARVLTAAVLLDLAYLCRIRPAVEGERVEPGKLVALSGSTPLDPVVMPAFELLQRKPLTPVVAIARLRKRTQDDLVDHLERTDQIQRIRFHTTRFSRQYAWPVINRERVMRARSELLSVLFDHSAPSPTIAAIISLLHACNGLGALLSLNDRGWRWVHARAGEIASGSWVDDSETAVAEVNLAVTASAMRYALAT